MRIVLVEDNQMLAQGIQKVLLDEGHSVDYFIDEILRTKEQYPLDACIFEDVLLQWPGSCGSLYRMCLPQRLQ